MTVRSVALVLLVTAVMGAGAMLIYDISLESAIVLAPVFVISAGLVAGLVVVWFKAARDNLRGR